MRVVIVGGGILGLATARLIASTRADAEIIVLEKESTLAHHQTGHNSGVAHAGIYYTPGSLKATLCRRGLQLLRDFCEERRLPWNPCGKLVVAIEEHEVPPLRRLMERAQENGVGGLRWLEGAELTQIEPGVRGVAALHSPETAIVDFVAIAGAYGDDLRARGGEIRTGAEVTRIWRHSRGPQLQLADGSVIAADRAIVCAGLQADRLARASGEPATPRIVPFRGEYWQLRPERTGLVRGLIYPVPDPSLPFLGVHLTRKIDGSVWIGPNAVLSVGREAYRLREISPRDLYETLAWPGTWRMMRTHWRAGVAELERSIRKRSFVADAARYVPALTPQDVIRAPAGIRAQAVDRDGALVDDFRLGVSDGVAWVRNAPSPAATSSLAIAEELLARAFS